MKSLTLNNHFSETVEKLNTFEWPFNEKYENIHNEKLTSIIKQLENHPSIMKIKSKYAMQNQLLLKMLKISLKICLITQRLQEEYLLNVN